MDDFRVAGIVAGVLLGGYVLVKFRKGNLRKLDLLAALLLISGIVTLSSFPQIGSILASALQLENRLFALLVFSNLLLFAMFFYLLNQVRASNRHSGDIIRALARQVYSERYSDKGGARGEVSVANTKGTLLVVIPAYNEQEAIRGVLARMPKEILSYDTDTLVVVDGATDGTEAVAIEHNFPVATHLVNRGQGDALRTGFDIALKEGADIVVTMDADGQHLSEEMERLIAPIVDDEADFVLGSRFLGHYEEAGTARHWGIVLFSCLVSLLSGKRITDSCNGFRAIRASELRRLDLREDRFSAAELILEAARKKLRIKEVPISILCRTGGESKKPKRLGYPLGFLRTIVHTWLR